ncbi:MAG: gamma carbonic anhydrase family protein [Bacillota bacterium]|jgi:carbonic anhydrase/acetyltransferase-like protein (isoleucine patch superfamily)|nr:gamma carbonic anhydrase family protein [Clostridia bacterium]
MSKIFNYLGRTPQIEKNTFTAPGSCIIGDVTIKDGASIWYNCVLRADVNKIHIGRFSNIQDNTTVHADSGRGSGLPEGLPTIVGEYVTVGHNCVLHACTIKDYCLIGMGAIILDGAIIGKGSIIGAGTLITKGTVIPPFSVVVGSPGKIVRTMDENAVEERMNQAMHYYHLAMENKSSL